MVAIKVRPPLPREFMQEEVVIAENNVSILMSRASLSAFRMASMSSRVSTTG